MAHTKLNRRFDYIRASCHVKISLADQLSVFFEYFMVILVYFFQQNLNFIWTYSSVMFNIYVGR